MVVSPLMVGSVGFSSKMWEVLHYSRLSVCSLVMRAALTKFPTAARLRTVSLIAALPRPVVASSPAAAPNGVVLLTPGGAQFPVLIFYAQCLPMYREMLTSYTGVVSPNTRVGSSPVSADSKGGMSVGRLLWGH